MDEETFKKEVEKLRKERKPKEPFNWKKFGKLTYNLWISTSVKIYNGLVDFSKKVQDRQAANQKEVKKQPKKKKESSMMEPSKDMWEPSEEWKF